jgi:hypothetical protein
MSVIQKNVMESFLDKVGLQVRTNRMMHGDRERPEIEWAAIAATHMGHLMEAALKGDRCFIEKELLHTVAPLLELYRVTMENEKCCRE